jgi:hypothetical protein
LRGLSLRLGRELLVGRAGRADTIGLVEFFVPNEDGDGKMATDKAEAAWQACRKGAESDIGRDALARRVYQVHYVHNGRELHATVGKRQPHYDQDLVMAITAFLSEKLGVPLRCCGGWWMVLGGFGLTHRGFVVSDLARRCRPSPSRTAWRDLIGAWHRPN